MIKLRFGSNWQLHLLRYIGCFDIAAALPSMVLKCLNECVVPKDNRDNLEYVAHFAIFLGQMRRAIRRR